ncbi:MAG: hypothetical protein OXF88_03285 [Rhodobacteraceae bacterium]|nr:hypothetical protein [Paracoccaceae bacterium]MCY4139604.1 hypothetical protein [Paracoccaceae bacterium]
MSGDSLRRHLSMPGMLPVARDFLDRIPAPPDTRRVPLTDCLTSGPAVFAFRIPSILRINRQVSRGEDPFQARNLYLRNGLRELFRAYPFPDREPPCPAIAGEPGKEYCVSLFRSGS